MTGSPKISQLADHKNLAEKNIAVPVEDSSNAGFVVIGIKHILRVARTLSPSHNGLLGRIGGGITFGDILGDPFPRPQMSLSQTFVYQSTLKIPMREVSPLCHVNTMIARRCLGSRIQLKLAKSLLRTQAIHLRQHLLFPFQI